MSAVTATTPRKTQSATAGPMVLTTRGRRLLRLAVWSATTIVATLALLLLILSVTAGLAPGASAGDGGIGVAPGMGSSETPNTSVTVVVQPGDTLWQIAEANAPMRDPRSVVDDIVALNGLRSTGVQVSDVLLVPTS